MTRRQQLISQMREALNHLCSPSYSEVNEGIEFTIADKDFEFDEESLDDEGENYE